MTAVTPSFAQLVALACHDLRTPLATASGFARTLERLEGIGQPGERYIEMIGAASDQLADLLDLLSVVARIEGGRFEPQLRTTTTRQVAEGAAARLEVGRVTVEGDGGEIQADADWADRALAGIAEAARRHGGLDEITLTATDGEIAIGPIVDDAGAVAVGENLRDFPAAVGVRVLAKSGATVALDGQSLRVSFPS